MPIAPPFFAQDAYATRMLALNLSRIEVTGRLFSRAFLVFIFLHFFWPEPRKPKFEVVWVWPVGRRQDRGILPLLS